MTPSFMLEANNRKVSGLSLDLFNQFPPCFAAGGPFSMIGLLQGSFIFSHFQSPAIFVGRPNISGSAYQSLFIYAVQKRKIIDNNLVLVNNPY